MTAPSTQLHSPARWWSLSLVQQLANVGSEVERAFRASDAGNESRLRHALARALDLFDLTATDPRWRGPRRREILRAREAFCRAILDNEPEPSRQRQRQYFLAFGVAARSTAAM
jgi:hypothetical protein